MASIPDKVPQSDSIIGLRDRAIIGLMGYTFGRVSALVNMPVEDYYHSAAKGLRSSAGSAEQAGIVRRGAVAVGSRVEN